MALLLKRYLLPLLGIFVLGALADLISLSYPIILQRLVDGMSGTHSSTPNIFGLVVALALGGAVVMLVRDLLATSLSGRVDFEASSLLFGKILRIPFPAIRARSTGQWLVAMQQIKELKSAVGVLGTQVLFDVILVIGYLGILFHYDTVAAFIYLGAVITTLIGLGAVSRTMYSAVDAGYEKKANAETSLNEALRSPLLIRAFQLGDWVQKRWAKPYDESVRHFQKADYLNGLFGAFFQVIHQAAPLFILAWKLPEVSRGTLTFGSAFALSTVFGLGFDPLLKISVMISQLQKTLYGFRTVREIVDLAEEPGNTERDLAPAGAPLSVRFEQVNFQYRTAADTSTLTNVNLTAGAGEKIAIVGHSGAGKSTLFNLLMRLYSPTSGNILIDERSIEQVPVGVLRRWIGIVSQDTELFSGTVLENIALCDNPDLVRAKECAELANATKFITSLPEGFDTQVGEDGSRLSAGQKQRISLARAIYWNPRLILLDEPTSALDAITEQEIAATLPRIAAGRTLIVAAHRLKSIQDFDRIYAMEHGCIVESGNHAELLAKDGYYSRLWHARPNHKQDHLNLGGTV